MIRVLGAGVAGLAVSTELVARGAEVELVDPSGPPGAHSCSWWAGGMLAPWCEFENAEEPVLRLGQEALKWWRDKTELTNGGTLVVANRRDLPDLKRFSRRTSGFETLDQDKVQELEPDLHSFSQALYFSQEAHLSPRQALADLTKGLGAAGIEIQAEPSASSAHFEIDCTGFAAREALTDLRGVKGEMLLLHAPDVHLSRPVRLLHPRMPLYVVPRGQGLYMLGATMIEGEDRKRITARSMLELLSAAYALSPAFGEAEVVEIGVDLRPAFPDNLPRVRKRGQKIYANGLYRHGFLLAPALAKAVADLVFNAHASELVDENHP
ncbi:MAG: FAD-dependent oxidoreductase [Pseudomonadota bacterium]